VGVTLRKNYGSGVPFPLFFIPQKSGIKKELHFTPSRGKLPLNKIGADLSILKIK
jgi:hypothetical protein